MCSISKRRWNEIQKIKSKKHISLKNDNRIYCRNAMRYKFVYADEAKAKVALRFNQEYGTVRYYECPSCIGFHLTSKPLWQYQRMANTLMPNKLIGSRI